MSAAGLLAGVGSVLGCMVAFVPRVDVGASVAGFGTLGSSFVADTADPSRPVCRISKRWLYHESGAVSNDGRWRSSEFLYLISVSAIKCMRLE